jgi:CspA family cold shock protein
MANNDMIPPAAINQDEFAPSPAAICSVCSGSQIPSLDRHARLFRARFRRGISYEESVMTTGTVKWFNDSKGFGFITPTDGGEDLFAHHTAIQMTGFKTLKEGQKVEFEVKRGPKGLQAANIKPL